MSSCMKILQVIGHPRDSKRISMLQSFGFEVEAIGFIVLTIRVVYLLALSLY